MQSHEFKSETYLLEIADKCPKNCLHYLNECLREFGLDTNIDQCVNKTSFISVNCSFNKLCEEAEKIELLKEVQGEEKVKEFVRKDIYLYSGSKCEETFFTSAEQLFLLENLLHTVPFSKGKFLECGLKSFGVSDSIVWGCLHSKPLILESYTPKHNQSEKKQLWEKVTSNPFVLPVHDIRNYYGEEIAYYFAWMSFLTRALLPISLFGIFTFFHRPKNVTVDDSHFLPFYALAMAFWTIIYNKYWRRQEEVFALDWNTTDVEKKDMIRPEFTGVSRKSPITGENEKYFPAWKRRIRFVISFFLSLPFLLLGVLAMILSLNLNGYIKHPESPIHIAFLAHFAEPGNIFAGDNKYYGWMVPTIAHSIVINLLNRLYSAVAHYSTDVENHRTIHQWTSSLIIKRVLFELFDCYLPLFYIAFYQLDIISLRRELIGLFWGDEIRRLITESLLPYISTKIERRRHLQKVAIMKKTDEHENHNDEVLKNLAKEEYEQFDDYIEMVIQYGYVTLFASAFPLCSVITIVFLFVEARSDIFKLMFLSRKPHVRRAKGIGVWFKVLSIMTVVSMLTNCFLFGFASEQLATWVPEMYETHSDRDQWIKLGYGRYVVGIVFVAEHLLILCLILSHYAISDVPVTIRNELARREHFRKLEFKTLKLKSN